jgi:prepilin-type N-terminal cleavage/methylation domain-containing protein
MIIHIVSKDENTNGFTLLELLIAIFLLSIGLLAAATMQGVAMNANSYANRISVASMVGQLVAEDLSSLKKTDPLLNTPAVNASYDRMFDPSVNSSTADISAISGAGSFSAKYDVVPDTPIAGTTLITIRVFYNNAVIPLVTLSTCKTVI